MGTKLQEVRVGTIRANGAELYNEVRGDGPPVVFISGATGDAGHFAGVAPLLADGFTVVTYDRRSNSRSPRPAGWMSTSMSEQADDCAALIEGLGIAPAVVFGTSGGAVILLDLLLRRPDVVRGAIVHEPPIVAVTSNGEQVSAGLQAMVEQGMAAGGPRKATELFIRWAAGDDAFDALDPDLRERMLDNGDVVFGVEIEAFLELVPTAQQIAAIPVPVVAAAGEENRDASSEGHYLYEATEWLAAHLGKQLVVAPGAHVPYLLDPAGFVEWIRPILRELARVPR
jgi:pimeloyl-ACP methyl ester carboxylesterase